MGEHKIHLYEPNGDGHRLEYASQVLREAARQGVATVLLTSDECLRSADFAEHLSRAALRPGAESVQRGRASVRGAARASVRSPASSLIVLDADRMPLVVVVGAVVRLWRPGSRVCALIMRPPWGGRGRTARTKSAVWTLVSRLPRVRLFALGDCFGDLPQTVPRRVGVIADKPVLYGSPDTRRVADRPTTLLLGGVVDSRKAPAAVCVGALEFTDLQVRIAGRVEPSLLGELGSLSARFPGRLTVDNDFLSNAELDAAVAASDMVSVVLRTRVGSSGMLGRAVAFGKPVLAAGNETVVAAVRKRNLGVVASGLTPEAIGAALRTAQADLGELREASQQARSEMLATEPLAAAILALIARSDRPTKRRA